jgi:urease accessory protein
MAIAIERSFKDASTGDLALVRLLQLVSPTLPTGAFSYSQGIEWAVEAGWLGSAEELEDWLLDQLEQTLVRFDLPLLLRMADAIGADDDGALTCWIDWLLAGRESAELRAEEGQRGRALAELLAAWGLPQADDKRALLARSQLAGFAFAAQRWAIDTRSMGLGYAWSWAENLVLAGVKIVPLGQRQGQQLLARLAAAMVDAVEQALALTDDEIGASTPALAIASANHETQYTRMFRS